MVSVWYTSEQLLVDNNWATRWQDKYPPLFTSTEVKYDHQLFVLIMLEREEKCYKKDMFHSPEFAKDQIQNLNATTKIEGFCFKSLLTYNFSCLSSSSSGERTWLLLLCLLYYLGPGRSNRKLSTYPLSSQLNCCLWYAKYRTCHRNEKKNCLHVNKNWVIE